VTRRLSHLVPLRVRRPLGRGAYELAAAVRRGPGSLRDALGGLPFLAARDLVYDDAFYDEMGRESTALQERLADALVELWAPRTVVDVGCGSGLLLARLARAGVGVQGVEGSRAALRRVDPSVPVVRANLERRVPAVGAFDLCVCLEVAEHLRPRSGPRLVAGLAALSDTVVFTAAQPGQPGTSHLNTRPKQYWRSLFAAAGFMSGARESELAAAIADVPEPAYLHPNLMVLERAA
jgi:SAM-dependent methyltransferase